jgi:transposase
MASLCREFGISRKTGYKIFERYEECGLEGLSDRTRRPFRYANQLPEQLEAAIVRQSMAQCSRAARRNVGFPYVIHSGARKTIFKKEKSDAIRIVDLRIAGGFRRTEKRWG